MECKMYNKESHQESHEHLKSVSTFLSNENYKIYSKTNLKTTELNMKKRDHNQNSLK